MNHAGFRPLSFLRLWLSALLFAAVSGYAEPLSNARYTLALQSNGDLHVSLKAGAAWTFRPDFTVLVAKVNPALAMRPGGIPRVSYNVPTWKTPTSSALKKTAATQRSTAQAGDGFDDSILDGDTQSRTSDAFSAAPGFRVTARQWQQTGRTIRFTFPESPDFTLSASVELPTDVGGSLEPRLSYALQPKSDAWYSVAYTGAPEVAREAAEEFWQPFLWQEKRFPSQSYLTPAFECSLPATFVRRGQVTVGVVVDADEFPFQPLPLLENSRFGVALRNREGNAQPMVFAPVLGGAGSKRRAGESFSFRLHLYLNAGEATLAYEDAARRLYGFRDYRTNAISTLNQTLDRMIDYGLSDYSWFVDALKGCAYSTDVPGAVKNVSALNPLNLALVTDNAAIFERRAYPIIEFLLSREKFLFSLDPKQKIQSPSRALLGPSAPVSELAAYYGIGQGASPVFLRLAQRLTGQDRTLNLDEPAPGNSWQNHLRLYQTTGAADHLKRARAGADVYLAERMERGSEDFNAPGFFFFTNFTPKWIDLLELFEATKDQRYLDAARLGARRYTMFTWVAPRIPDEEVTVNPGGNAPVYWYLKNKGHKPMTAPEEKVPAWRVSEIGLTPESSGTMSGHRAIFMANFAPWMLRIAALTGDALLHDVARSAVIGRYRNFPGYHMNTARSTIYEGATYPLRPHEELSVNSFHYNHIWPMMSILLDYLVTDAFSRSRGAIDFPSRFVEGYAYLQSKIYGDRPGKFFGYDDAVLWMPQRLLQTGSVELNFVAARGKGRLYLAFTNQSREAVSTDVVFDQQVLPLQGKTYRVQVLGAGKSDTQEMRDGRFRVSVPPMGLTAVAIEGLSITPAFQQKVLAATPADAWREDYLELPFGRARAMVLNFGAAATNAYVYLQADDAEFRDVTLTYSRNGERHTLKDASYPFEFTVPLSAESREFTFELSGTGLDGRVRASAPAALRK